MSGEKRPLGLTNRRGHSLEIRDIDLTELSIDVQPETPDDFREAAKKRKPVTSIAKKPNVHSPSRRDRKHTPHRAVVLVLAALTIIVLPIAGGEIVRAQYAASRNNAEKAFERLVANDVLPAQKNGSDSGRMAQIIAKIESVRDDMCPGAMFDNIASLYPRAKAAHDDCLSERGRIARLASGLETLQEELAYAETVSGILARVTAPSGDTFAVVADQLNGWKQVEDKLKAVSPPTELNAAHKQLLDAIRSITEGWSKLAVANNEKNADAFAQAEKQLQTGYTAVRDCRSVFVAAIAEQQNLVTERAEEVIR